MATRDLLTQLLFLRPPRPPESIPAGLHHYMRQADGTYTRFHLRVEPDGSGMLLANATAAARLSPSGVLIAKGLLDGEDEAMILRNLAARFQGATRGTMRSDLLRVKALIEELAAPGDNYPIINLEDAAVSPYEARLMSPLRADVPLAAPERVLPIIDRLWEAAIPHVTFLVPEDPNPSHLVRAVERAEDTGMIAGVRARGSDLGRGTLMEDLALAGVDHVTSLYISAYPKVHESLCGDGDHAATERLLGKVQELEVCPVAEFPLVEATVDSVEESLTSLIEMGVTNVSFFAIAAPDEWSASERDGALTASAVRQAAALVEDTALDEQVRYLWEPPVMRNPAKTLAMQVRQGPRCSGDLVVRVEPDGSVIPPRGPYLSTGNLLRDSWDTIWGNEAFRIYRERVESPTRCDVCPGLAICAADCPCEPAGWSQEV